MLSLFSLDPAAPLAVLDDHDLELALAGQVDDGGPLPFTLDWTDDESGVLDIAAEVSRRTRGMVCGRRA